MKKVKVVKCLCSKYKALSSNPSTAAHLKVKKKFKTRGQVQWLMPIIPTTQEVEVGMTTVQGQLGQIVRSHLNQ
jgi:hypothetical protein